MDIESGAGSVFLRTTSIDCKNKDILDVVERVVKSANLKSKMAAFFVPTWSLVVTWDHVGYYPNGTDKASLPSGNLNMFSHVCNSSCSHPTPRVTYCLK